MDAILNFLDAWVFKVFIPLAPLGLRRVVKKEIEYTVMVPCIEYEKKIIVDKIPRVHKEIYEEIREVPVLDTEQVTKCCVEWTGK